MISGQVLGTINVRGRAHAKVPGAQVTGAYGVITTIGRASVAIKVPAGAFDDFSVFGLSDPDPAMVYVGPNNGGSQSGAYNSSYARQYMIFSPPQHYGTSGSSKAWSRAAFAGLGFKYSGITANNWQYLEDVQLEESPLSRSAPAAFESPRRIQAVVKPTRLNLVMNASFETAASNWTPVNATLTRISSDHHGSGTSCLQVVTSAAGSVSQTLSGLITGRRYTASAWVKIPAAGASTNLSWGTTGVRVLNSASLQSSDIQENGWVRVWSTFEVTSTTVVLRLLASGAFTFLLDEVLVEEGETLRSYFDGGFGDDYLWESGGTVGIARSYYYEQRRERAYLVRQLLDENTPVGITAKDPIYANLPTQ